MKNNQKGFSTVEVLLVFIIIILIGIVGWLVYDNHNKTNKKSNDTKSLSKSQSQKSSSATNMDSPRYFIVKEWGVRAPIIENDNYTYTFGDNNKIISVASKNLAAKDSECSTWGAGQIDRLQAGDDSMPGGGGPTVEQASRENPGMFYKVDGYYYRFIHDQAGCGHVSIIDQNKANDSVKALVAKFQAVPN